MARRAETLVGKRLRVLVERFEMKEGTWIGRSHREAPEIDGDITFIADEPLRVGTFVDVEVTGASGSDLLGAVRAEAEDLHVV